MGRWIPIAGLIAIIVGIFWTAIAWARQQKRALKDPWLRARMTPAARLLLQDVDWRPLVRLPNLIVLVAVCAMGVAALEAIGG